MTWRSTWCASWVALGTLSCGAGHSAEATDDSIHDDAEDGVDSGNSAADDDASNDESPGDSPETTGTEPEAQGEMTEPTQVTPTPCQTPPETPSDLPSTPDASADPSPVPVAPVCETPVPVSPAPVTAIPPPATAEACPDMCGNGAVDSCETCSDGAPGGTPVPLLPAAPLGAHFRVAPVGPPVQQCVVQREQCDGSAGTTCDAIGFSGGTLECGELCTFDESGCESCGTDEHIASCRDDVSQTVPRILALAAKEASAALVWADSGMGVFFAAYDDELEPTVSPTALPASALRVAVAPLPSGWFVAADQERYTLLDDGNVSTQGSVAGSSPLFVASRPGSTPLLVSLHTSTNTVVAALMADDGSSVWETEITSAPVEAEFGSATAVLGGFLVALRGASGVEVWSLDEEDGTLTSAGSPGGPSTEYPQLASNGTSAALVWADFAATPSVYWAPLDAKGVGTADPVLLGGSPDYFNRSPIAMDGDDTIVLMGGYTGTTGVGSVHRVRRVDAAGSTLYGDYALQNDPNGLLWPQLAWMGDALVAAWVAQAPSNRIGLAKLTP